MFAAPLNEQTLADIWRYINLLLYYITYYNYKMRPAVVHSVRLGRSCHSVGRGVPVTRAKNGRRASGGTLSQPDILKSKATLCQVLGQLSSTSVTPDIHFTTPVRVIQLLY